MALQSKKSLKFQRDFQEYAVTKNNLAHGIKCEQGTELDDFKHIDIKYANGETEDCKYCGRKGVFISEGTLTSQTTWISSIIGQIDYKVKREKIYEKYKNDFQYDEKRQESFVYILPDDFKKLSTKQIKMDDAYLDWYEQGKKITYFGNNTDTDDMICEKLEKWKNEHSL